MSNKAIPISGGIPIQTKMTFKEELITRRSHLQAGIDKINHILRLIEKNPEVEEAIETIASLNQPQQPR